MNTIEPPICECCCPPRFDSRPTFLLYINDLYDDAIRNCMVYSYMVDFNDLVSCTSLGNGINIRMLGFVIHVSIYSYTF